VCAEFKQQSDASAANDELWVSAAGARLTLRRLLNNFGHACLLWYRKIGWQA
jgi:hypothetical protein